MAGRHKIYDLEFKYYSSREWGRVRSYERKQDALAAGMDLTLTHKIPLTHIRVVNITTREVTNFCNQGDTNVKANKSECEAFLEIKFDDGASVRKLGPLSRENATYIYDIIKRSPNENWGIAEIIMSVRMKTTMESNK